MDPDGEVIELVKLSSKKGIQPVLVYEQDASEENVNVPFFTVKHLTKCILMT